MSQAVATTPAVSVGELHVVAEFYGPMPTGATVSHDGRVFACFPRWGDPVDYTVAEIADGEATAFPDPELNRPMAQDPAAGLVSVQSVVVDPRNRLWLLDTGSINFGPAAFGGPKLVGVDLRANRIFSTVLFPPDVALPTTCLNDVRFDLRRGSAGMAFITDSSTQGPNGIIAVDLDSGRSWRRLHHHPTTRPVPGFLPIVEGRPLMERRPGQAESHVGFGSDGIAISADGERLYYCPLASRRLYSVSADALADPSATEGQVAETVLDHGEKGASDGLETDADNRVYATNYEHNAVLRRRADGTYETVAHDPRLLWPDTLSVGMDGYLYIIANQLHRQPSFHWGEDLRRKPYYLFRTPIDSGPVLLR